MPDPKVRIAKLSDAAIVSQFNQLMALETENKQLDPATIDNGVKRLMQKPEYGFYLIAERNGETAGTCMVTTEWSDWRDGLFWWVQSVYVIKGHRKKGVYRAMYGHIRMLAEQQPDICGFRLYVEKDNITAQKTYESLGMLKTDYLLYETINNT